MGPLGPPPCNDEDMDGISDEDDDCIESMMNVEKCNGDKINLDNGYCFFNI